MFRSPRLLARNVSRLATRDVTPTRLKTATSTIPKYIGSNESYKDRNARIEKLPIVQRAIEKYVHGPDISSADRILSDHHSRYSSLEPLHRFDTREPSEIFMKGMKPRGSDLNFVKHQQGGANLANSGLISTSKTFAGAEDVRLKTAHAGKEGFIYKLQAHHNDSFSLGQGLAVDPTFDSQEEVAIAGSISPERFTSVIDTRTNTETTRSDFLKRKS